MLGRPAQRFGREAARLGVARCKSALVGLYLLGTGCGAEPVEARAIWVDEARGDARRRIHVYDRGAIESFEVLGDTEPLERVLLDPRGRGLVVRTGDRRGAWFDLDDGRRLPLLLPSSSFGATIGFADGALTWIDDHSRALTVVPLSSGLALSRRGDGTLEPLTRGSALYWSVAASQAPIVFAADVTGTRASFFRYPTSADQPLVIALEAEASGLSLPASARQVALEPGGELAIYSSSIDASGPWELFDRRAPESAGALELPPALEELQATNNLVLLQVLDRRVSVWSGAGQLHRHDRLRGTVESLPTFASPSAFASASASASASWTAVEQGRAGILTTTWGPVYRVDLTGLRSLSLDTTECQGASEPVVSPSGAWIAWACADTSLGSVGESGALVRVSAAGLERYVGVPMTTLAIDDDGDLLLYSSNLVGDGLDVIGSTRGAPRTLFVLSGDGVLTRIDDLEPTPAPILLGASAAETYIQAAALVR
ncbi:MAG: hypothetical protein R6X02_26100 [Enhygromyxa sp.]